MNDSQIITAQVIGGGVKTMESNNQIIPWWSFGKTAIAAATLRLVQDDRLELDASFEGKPYTLRQLLMHTSGLSDYGMLRDYHEAVEHNEHPWDFSDMVERVNVDTLLFEPGKKFSYSNVGYALIRNKIERMTDKNLQKSLEELVFTPLKIKGVTVANNTSDLDVLAGGNSKNYNPGWVYHGLLIGPFISAPLFLHRLLTTDFLSQAIKKEILTTFPIPSIAPDRPIQNPSYGLGVIEGATKKGKCIGHTGQGPGSTIAVYHFPNESPLQTKIAYILNDQPEQQAALENFLFNS